MSRRGLVIAAYLRKLSAAVANCAGYEAAGLTQFNQQGLTAGFQRHGQSQDRLPCRYVRSVLHWVFHASVD